MYRTLASTVILTLTICNSVLAIEVGSVQSTCTSLPNEDKYRKCQRFVRSADHVTCQCRDCDLSVTLACHLGVWRPIDGFDLCEAADSWFGCERCVPPHAVQDIQCDLDSTPGHLGEMRRCRCKNTCLDVTIKCHVDDLWHYDCTVPVLQFIPSKHLSLHYNATLSLYTFNCSPGYHIQGEHRLLCQHGRFGGNLPQCVPNVADFRRFDEPSITNLARLKRRYWRRRRTGRYYK